MQTNWDSFGSMEELVQRYLAEAEQDAKNAERKTGFDNLDGVGDFHAQPQIFAPGIYVIGAPSSAGKTTFALQLMKQLADKTEPSLFLSYEMEEKALLRKLVAHEFFKRKSAGDDVYLLSSVDIQRAGIKKDFLVEGIKEMALIDRLKIKRVDWQAEELLKQLYDFAEYTKKNFSRPPTIAIDYLQLVPNQNLQTAKDKIDYLLVRLREFQVKTQATLILISSLNRSNELKDSLTLSCFKESGAIEYTADVVWVLEPIRKDSNETRIQAEKRMRESSERAMYLRCLKNREGACYEVCFVYHAVYDTFKPSTKAAAEAIVKESAENEPEHCK